MVNIMINTSQPFIIITRIIKKIYINSPWLSTTTKIMSAKSRDMKINIVEQQTVFFKGTALAFVFQITKTSSQFKDLFLTLHFDGSFGFDFVRILELNL